MPDNSAILELQALPTGCLCNAHHDVRAMSAEIKALYPGARLAGRARTGRAKQGDNAVIHRLAATAGKGDVLVVDAGASEEFGLFGDILATACQSADIAGLVIDGTVRDIDDIEKLHFPVFGRGLCPGSSAKEDPGEIDSPITCGGVTLAPGDYVVGDSDGVVVVPNALVEEVIVRAKAVLKKEREIMERLKAGVTTVEIFGIRV